MADSTSELLGPQRFTVDAVIGRWRGKNPYFLLVRQYVGTYPTRVANTVTIDLNEPQWATIHKDILRKPGSWMLCSKVLSEKQGKVVPILIVQVEEGEQPFYAMRHIGVVGSGGSAEISTYGIGVKRRDGKVDGVFILPNGSITTDDDVYWIGDRMNKGQL